MCSFFIWPSICSCQLQMLRLRPEENKHRHSRQRQPLAMGLADGQSGNCAAEPIPTCSHPNLWWAQRLKALHPLPLPFTLVSLGPPLCPGLQCLPCSPRLLCLSIWEGKRLRVKCSPGLNYHFKVLSHNPDSQGLPASPACLPYGGVGEAPDINADRRAPDSPAIPI